MDDELIDKVTKSLESGELNLSADDLAEVVIFTIDFQVRNKTVYMPKLRDLYGIPHDNKTIQFYSKAIFPDLVSKNNAAMSLFWSMLNDMNRKILSESILESVNNTSTIFLFESINQKDE